MTALRLLVPRDLDPADTIEWWAERARPWHPGVAAWWRRRKLARGYVRGIDSE